MTLKALFPDTRFACTVFPTTLRLVTILPSANQAIMARRTRTQQTSHQYGFSTWVQVFPTTIFSIDRPETSNISSFFNTRQQNAACVGTQESSSNTYSLMSTVMHPQASQTTQYTGVGSAGNKCVDHGSLAAAFGVEVTATA